MKSNLIVALDFHNKAQAMALVHQIDPDLCALKVGSEMFTHFGPEFVRELVQAGFRVFLDLKWYDIPTTVANACKAAADLGVWMVNVHASGGAEMMTAARKALIDYGKDRPHLIAVTVLTSFADDNLLALNIKETTNTYALHLAKLADAAGLDGVVCAVDEALNIKTEFPENFLTVTPGIRLDNTHQHDQVRTATPIDARNALCDYIVVGRAITQSTNPGQVVKEILKMLNPATDPS